MPGIVSAARAAITRGSVAPIPTSTAIAATSAAIATIAAAAAATTATRRRAGLARGHHAGLRALALLALGEGNELAARETDLAVTSHLDDLHLDLVALFHD